MRSSNHLVIGSAQFGLNYGINNRRGKPDVGHVRNIIEFAYHLGIRFLDTATAYGDSETVLGECGIDRWSVITKVPSCQNLPEQEIGAFAYASVQRSLDRLKIESLHAVLAHDWRDAVGDRGRRLRDGLEPLVASGRIKKIGVSVYKPEDMHGIEAMFTQIVQAPVNVLDQRFITSGAAARLYADGAELYARSIFLQGLLLMNTKQRPAQFYKWTDELARYDKRVQFSGLKPAAFCLGYVAKQETITRMVVGVDTKEQLMQVVDALREGQQTSCYAEDLCTEEARLIDPRQWERAT